MFACSLESGMCFGFPNACQTPTPVGPLPIPYPSIAECCAADPGTACPSVLLEGAPAMNMMTEIPTSEGDEAGSAGGVVSGTFGQVTKFISGSAKVIFDGSPAVFLGSATTQNGFAPNVSGMVNAPSQESVLINS